MSEKATIVYLSDLIRDRIINPDDIFTWKRDSKNLYKGIIQKDGSIYCDDLQPTLHSPSSFCQAVANIYERKGNISGPREGLINGKSLEKIIDDYRVAKNMKVSKRSRKTKERPTKYAHLNYHGKHNVERDDDDDEAERNESKEEIVVQDDATTEAPSKKLKMSPIELIEKIRGVFDEIKETKDIDRLWIAELCLDNIENLFE